MKGGKRQRQRKCVSGHRWLSLLFTMQWMLLTVSCIQDAYEKGQGKYSLMRADFVEAHANDQKQIDSFTTDDGISYQTTKPFGAKWVTTPDSIYRCILYYNKVDDGGGISKAEPISAGQVACLIIKPRGALKGDMKTDAVRFESAWLSGTGRYLNLSLYVKTGVTDDEQAMQTISMVEDTVKTNPDATRTVCLRLYHDQGGVPEYYSTQVYASVPLSGLQADSLRISIQSYQGEVVKTFRMPE